VTAPAAAAFDLAGVVERERPLVPLPAMQVASMLAYEERALLHWAGRESFGALVDAGCFLGGSTLALGFGLRSSGRTDGRIHSYDLFEVGGEWERIYFPDDFPFAIGTTTLPLYESHIAPVRELVEVHHGDVRGFRWRGEPIGTLFIDIAKSWGVHDHVLGQFFPSLVPGSLVIQQDLVHFGHPWCAISMELLDEHVEYLGHVHFSSAVYRVRCPIARAALPTRLLERLTADEALALVDRCAERVGEPMAGQVRLAGAGALACWGEFGRARERVGEVAARYDDSTVPFISSGLGLMPQWIDGVESGEQPVA
jgi:hypothetical protein